MLHHNNCKDLHLSCSAWLQVCCVYSSWPDSASTWPLSLHHSSYIQSNKLSCTTIPMGQICLGYGCSKKFMWQKNMDFAYPLSSLDIEIHPPPTFPGKKQLFVAQTLSTPPAPPSSMVKKLNAFTPSSRALVKLQAFQRNRSNLRDSPKRLGRWQVIWLGHKGQEISAQRATNQTRSECYIFP